MATTPESKVKAKIHAILKAQGAYAVNYIGGIAANNGTPDILACLHGRFIGIEAKAGTNTPTAIQLANLKKIDAAGGLALGINETNLPILRDSLEGAHPQSNYHLFEKPSKDAPTDAPTKRTPKDKND